MIRRKDRLGENATSDAWGKMLAGFDCVVVVRDHPDYNIDFIRKHAKHVVDARAHGFDAAREQTAKEQHKPINVTYTGVVPIVYKAQRTLLHSLIDSIWWAFVMIAAVMMVLVRNEKSHLFNLRGGLVAMIPNIFPVILIFGAMGHMRLLVDIGTMMTASVAMGVAVDDTIHFLTWFRRGIREGLERKAAIKQAYGRVALAMTQTTLIGGLGLSVFALSTFTPTQRFRHHDADTAGRRAVWRSGPSPGPAGRAAGQVSLPKSVTFAQSVGGRRPDAADRDCRRAGCVGDRVNRYCRGGTDAQPSQRRQVRLIVLVSPRRHALVLHARSFWPILPQHDLTWRVNNRQQSWWLEEGP